MSETKTQTKTRQHEHTVDIGASPETVWKAITDASELVNWFPLDAEVTPGEGGQITLGWGEALRGSCSIQIWEPGRRLKTSWMAADSGGQGPSTQLAVDWFLNGEDGGTRLRLVHSGFGPGQEWDEEYNGTRRGWTYELRSLKHYLEHHHAESRRAFWLRQPFPASPQQAWERLVNPEGLIQTSGLDASRAGDPVNLTLSTGDKIEGHVLLSIPPTDIAFVVDNWNQGLFRAAHENCGQGPELSVFVSLWGYPENQAKALEGRLEGALKQAAG